MQTVVFSRGRRGKKRYRDVVASQSGNKGDIVGHGVLSSKVSYVRGTIFGDGDDFTLGKALVGPGGLKRKASR